MIHGQLLTVFVRLPMGKFVQIGVLNLTAFEKSERALASAR